MSMIGQTVSFWDWDKQGKEVKLTGVVQDEFREPEGEDRYQRLNYSVLLGDGRVMTPYADDCRPEEPEACCVEAANRLMPDWAREAVNVVHAHGGHVCFTYELRGRKFGVQITPHD